MICKYNTIKNKTPIGGVDCKDNIHIEFLVLNSLDVKDIFFVMRKESEIYIKLPLINKGLHDNEYDLYYCDFKVPNYGIYFYRFEIITMKGTLFVGKSELQNANCMDWLPEFQLTACEGNFSKGSLNGGIVYHIFVDRFFKPVNPTIPFNKIGRYKEWGSEVDIQDEQGNYDAKDFFGGNLYGIIEKLDYLKALNVSHIYLSPIFDSTSNHRYDTGDYMKVDELLGGDKAFELLIEKAKEKNIGIILDGVFNHSGADSVYFNKFNNYDSIGAYQSKKSNYYNWYTFSKYPNLYDAWWGMTCVPTFNKENISLRNFFTGNNSVIEKWTKKGIAGWRLDVADELPTLYLDEIRNCIYKNNDKAVVIGEVWEDASVKISYSTLRPYFTKKQLDGVMNYVFYEAIVKYIFDNNIEDFTESVLLIVNNYPKYALDNSFTLLGSHDTVRILNRLSNKNVSKLSKKERLYISLQNEELNFAIKRLKIAALLQFSLPGVPSIYYGDEIGMQGYEDPINRRCMEWNNINDEVLSHYKILSKIRKKYEDIFKGYISFESFENLLILKRFNDKQSIKIVINNSNKNVEYNSNGKSLFKTKNEILKILKPLDFDIILS